MNTKGFGGKLLSKNVEVYTNDPKQEKIRLTIRGEVEFFATVNPKLVRLNGYPGEKITGKVMVIPSGKYPFNVLGFTLRSGENVDVSLKKPVPEKAIWKLDVKNLKKTVGRYYDVILLETDSTIQPKIEIRIFGNIFQKEEVKQE